jgi:genome maintenance exonuclease 1
MKITLPVLQKITQDNGTRHYITPAGNRYPSVTTVISEEKKKQLAAWRKWVGQVEADRIKNFAANRGTHFHKLCEQHLQGAPVQNNVGIMFDQFKPLLHRISNIQCMEQHLYSDHMQVAGQVDCVAEFDNYPMIIDFKTSSKLKLRKNIWDYFMQGAAYSQMYLERTGIDIPCMAILISCENPAGTCQIYIDKRDNWLDKFQVLRHAYDQVTEHACV